MGGGGGSGGRLLGDISALEEQAKQVLREGGERRCAFISFAYEDVDEVNLLRAQAKNEANELDFIDRSVREPFDSESAEYIKTKIRERINQCSVTIIFLSKHAAQSKWVEWEIGKSAELGKQLIAVHSGDKPPKALPTGIQKFGVKVVPWSELHKNIKP